MRRFIKYPPSIRLNRPAAVRIVLRSFNFYQQPTHLRNYKYAHVFSSIEAYARRSVFEPRIGAGGTGGHDDARVAPGRQGHHGGYSQSHGERGCFDRRCARGRGVCGATLKGAQNIPYKEKSAKSVDYNAKVDSFDVARLPADKSKAVIFYCNAGECWKSYKAAKAAIKAGYTNAHWLRGGIPEWKAKGYPVE
ncbi:MAG: rhodanese-like domain-containing protein [Sulfuricaulis sp.]|nr:rhodanese-like domain-containing protein [Sulfuricaulis sp.]